MGFSADQISDAFESAAKALPDVVVGQNVLSMGTFGLVLANETDVITKILFRHKDPYWEGLSEEHSQNEIAALRYFTHSPLEGVETPVLIDEPKALAHDDYAAYYQMTRLQGRSMSWHPENKSTSEQERLSREGIQAGRVLARFHQASKDIPANTFKEANPIKHGHIHCVESLPPFINDALSRANDYLQQRKAMGIIHGDFHGGNIIMTPNQDTDGVIDFGFMGYANLYYDFIKAKPYFMPALIEGYEMETGESVDKKLITASILGRYASRLIKLETDKPDEGFDPQNPERQKVIGTIIECLQDMNL